MTLTTLLNAQNAAGLDQNGAIGGALLSVGGPQVLSNSGNTGNAAVTATVSNLGGLTTSNYYLGYDGSNWSLLDTASGAAAPLTASTSGGVTTLTGAGMTLSVTGTAKAGDQFLVEPTGAAVAGLALLTTDPTKIAAAGALVSSASRPTAARHASSAPRCRALRPGLAATTRSAFTSPTAYTDDRRGGATVSTGAYTAGTPIAFNGIARHA